MRVFRLSVNPDGMVSLWDSPEQREDGAEESEVYLDMPLTAGQEWRLLRAQPECDKCMTHKREIAQLLIEVRNLRDQAQGNLNEVERLNVTQDMLRSEVRRLEVARYWLEMERKV